MNALTFEANKDVASNVVSIIVPVAPGARTYWHCAGDLFWNAGGRGVWISLEDAHRRRAIYYENLEGRQYIDLTNALDALANHNRAVGKPDPYASQTEVSDRLRGALRLVSDRT